MSSREFRAPLASDARAIGRALAWFARVCEAVDCSFAVVGAVAAAAHGEPLGAGHSAPVCVDGGERAGARGDPGACGGAGSAPCGCGCGPCAAALCAVDVLVSSGAVAGLEEAAARAVACAAGTAYGVGRVALRATLAAAVLPDADGVGGAAIISHAVPLAVCGVSVPVAVRGDLERLLGRSVGARAAEAGDAPARTEAGECGCGGEEGPPPPARLPPARVRPPCGKCHVRVRGGRVASAVVHDGGVCTGHARCGEAALGVSLWRMRRCQRRVSLPRVAARVRPAARRRRSVRLHR